MLDYLLLGLYPSEEDIVAVQQARAAAPIGQPRRVADVPLPPRRNAFDVEDEAALLAGAAPAVPPPPLASPSGPARASQPLVPPPSGAGPVAPAASREQP